MWGFHSTKRSIRILYHASVLSFFPVVQDSIKIVKYLSLKPTLKLSFSVLSLILTSNNNNSLNIVTNYLEDIQYKT